MKHGEAVNLGVKWVVGMSASLSVGLEDNLRVLALALGILVSVLTIANLAWSLWDKIKRRMK